MPEYLKTTEDKGPIVIHYIENYSADDVLTIMKKQDFDFQKFYNDNPKLLASMLEHFSIEKEMQAKVLHIWKSINYQFNPDDILYYIGDNGAWLNSYFYNNLFNYIIDNGTDINFKRDNETVIEKIFTIFLTDDHNTSQSRFIKKQITEGRWDLSVSDSNGRDSLDYLNNVIKHKQESQWFTRKSYVSRYKTVLLGEQENALMQDKSKFLKKVSSLTPENKEIASLIIPSLFFYDFKFLDKDDLHMQVEKGAFLKNVISFLDENHNTPGVEYNHMLKLFETPVLNPENSYLFIDEKDFKNNVLKLYKLSKYDKSEPSYAHFTYLYANKNTVNNVFLYSHLIPEILNTLMDDRSYDDKDKENIFYALMDFFSYENIFKDDFLNDEVKDFLNKTDLDNGKNMLREYLILEEKSKLESIITIEKTASPKKRL